MTFFRRIRLSFRLTIGNRAGEGTRPIGAIIGIAIAIMPLIVVVHVSDAMISGIAERFIETGTYHMRARPQLSMNESDLAADVRRVQAIDGVEYATIERNGFGLVYSNALRSGVQIRAVDPHIYQNDPVFSSYLSVGQGEFSISDPNDIVIGRSIADNLQLNVGDTLRVLTVRSLPGGGVIPRVSPFTVRGIVSTGYQELDRLWVFMNSKRGDRILPPEDSSVSIGIKVEHPFALPNDLFRQPDTRVEETRTTSREIQDTLGSGYRIRTWFEEEQSRYLSFGTTRNALVVVMVLIMA
ncbi:MAG: ABC transporter permease, partial [Spirochaeta sp.]